MVTLAFFLGLQAVPLKLIGSGGSVRYNDEVLRGLSIKNMPVTAGWIAAGVIVVGFARCRCGSTARLRRRGLVHKPLALVLIQVAVLAAIVLGLTYLLSQNRAPQPELLQHQRHPVGPPRGHRAAPLLDVRAQPHAFGRHLYAVGGNAEAARRAGINVDRIKITAFVLCSSMAAVSGSARGVVRRQGLPRLGWRQHAAVRRRRGRHRWHQSFRRKGRAIDAVIGGLVIATIPNGLGLLNQASYINYLVTGGVLLLAASVDAISRRRRSAAGV